jgi:hypothetical protein
MVRTAWDVWTTHIGLLMRVVADPERSGKVADGRSDGVLEPTSNESGQHRIQCAQSFGPPFGTEDDLPRAFIEVVVYTMACSVGT